MRRKDRGGVQAQSRTGCEDQGAVSVLLGSECVELKVEGLSCRRNSTSTGVWEGAFKQFSLAQLLPAEVIKVPPD